MKALKVIGVVVLVLVAACVSFLFYMGAFSSQSITEKETGPYIMVYEAFTGPYMETSKAFDRVYESLKKDGIEPVLGIGIYYDDPSKTPADKLKSDCGSIISEKDLAALKNSKGKYQIRTLPSAKRVIVEFPIKNAMSYAFGPMIVYPQLGKYMKDKGYKDTTAGIEIYDMKNKKTIYLADILN